MSDILDKLTKARELKRLNGELTKEIFGFNGNERIAYMNGGLGNQLCQYFFYRFLECSGDDPVIADDTFFFANKVHNGYELEKIFKFKIKKLSDIIVRPVFVDMIKRLEQGESTPEQLYQAGYAITVIREVIAPKFSGNIYDMPSYHPAAAHHKGFTYYSVHAVIEDYFNLLRENNCISANPFPPLRGERNEKYADEIKSTESVALHIRRGDFVNLNWAFSPKLYKIAVDAINKKITNPTYFIFSDDLNYCKENLEDLGLFKSNVIFVEGNVKAYNYIDMQLMSMCRHRIVTNSSFSFCAALFRERRDGFVANLNEDERKLTLEKAEMGLW